METSSDTTKILEKGPEYLRKQMELEGETKGRMSAVERLAASKPKYVKSQQVVNSTQEPVISLGSASVSSTGSSSQSINRNGNLVSGSTSSVHKDVPQLCLPGQQHRPTVKKRPDSILLYRQKCDLLRGSALKNRRHPITRKPPLNSGDKHVLAADRECEHEGSKEKISTPEGKAKECSNGVVISQSENKSNGATEENSEKPIAGGLLAVPEIERTTGKGVSRSHSDISSRYSKNFADFDAFFKYCGLDGEVIETLGRENFSARSDEIVINIRSVSISTSDDGFSRDSGDSDGLLEDELHKKIRQGTSVIERNARIIKWLYSCKNASDAGKTLRDLD
ncbi:PREDICTED: protein FAM110C [Poecilia mexicana]|uniref:protein FAM110C n=1 Tax=Poecilia mexicana TaxID=48701 RepID=UPI00072DF4C9|nr:PREDICTED: protein FAM110C [Poecilia mexicana]